MKKVKIITIILAIVLVTLIAFLGIYVQVQNRMENKVKDYSYAMDLEGSREIRLKVDTSTTTTVKDAEGNEVEDGENLTDDEITQNGYTKEETAKNSKEVLNVENYEKTKKIIEERLKGQNVQNYVIKMDEETGDIIIDIPENDQTDAIISNISSTGKFEILDTQTNEVLMNNDDIKTVNVMYGSSSSTGTSGTTVYLNIEFTKEGAKKLEEISSNYKTVEESSETTDETTEESTEETNAEKTITMKIDDEEIMSTSFDEPLKTGKMQLSIGQAATTQEALQTNVNQAATIATVLDTGKLPVVYTVDENKYILSDMQENQLQIVGYVVIAIVAIALVVMIIRYRVLGILGSISYIGLLAMFSILIKYTNVVLSLEGIFGALVIAVLNYIFVNSVLNKLKKEEKIQKSDVKETIKETYKSFFIKIVPICITIIAFCFISWEPISSFGMVMFWGIVLIAIYNYVITNTLLKIKADK